MRSGNSRFHMNTKGVGAAEPARLGHTELPDGRKLGWAEWGREDGAPVVLCPGAATSRWLGFGADAVEALGVRLVSIDRPGLGASDPAPGTRTRSGVVAVVADEDDDLAARRRMALWALEEPCPRAAPAHARPAAARGAREIAALADARR